MDETKLDTYHFPPPPIGRTIPWVSRWAQLLQVQRGLTLRIQIVTLNVTHFSDPPIYLPGILFSKGQPGQPWSQVLQLPRARATRARRIIVI